MFISPVGDLLTMSEHPHFTLSALGDPRTTDGTATLHGDHAALVVARLRGSFLGEIFRSSFLLVGRIG
jgi:hypothetical protein